MTPTRIYWSDYDRAMCKRLQIRLDDEPVDLVPLPAPPKVARRDHVPLVVSTIVMVMLGMAVILAEVTR